MPADPRPHCSPRARPVVDAPAEALLARAEDLARAWAVALIGARPLADVGDIAFEHLAREAPSLCAQAVRALQSDVELDRLTGAGDASSRADSAPARQLAVIAGAADPAAAVLAVEALRGVLWEALLDELHEPSARQVGDIGDRLACVCATALATAVQAAFAPAARAALDQSEDVDAIREERDAGVSRVAPASGARLARECARVPEPGRRAVIVDERVPAASLPPSSLAAGTDEIEIRDVREGRLERGEHGPAAWIGSIGAELEQFERGARPFAVLLVELLEIERLHAEEPPEELLALGARMEQALAEELGSAVGSLTRERPGRCWLLMTETDRDRAHELAKRLARAVASRASNRGTPLKVAIGVAICPEDGREAAVLAAHADVGLYAARAAVRASAGERTAGRGGA
jgi:hypothetical protein